MTDAIGNILQKTSGARVFTYAYNDPLHRNLLSGISVDGTTYPYEYDSSGNMTFGPDFTQMAQVGSRSVVYGSDGMPSTIADTRTGQAVEFVYGPGGERVMKRTMSSTTLHAASRFEEKDGVVQKYIFAGGMRVAKINGTGVQYYHQDHLGNTGIVTDSRGARVEATEYMPFGAVREQDGPETTGYRYTGKELDPETGLYNYGGRYYDPMIGRFVMADTIIPGLSNSQAMNPYSYALNNPLVYNDPTGHYASPAFKKERGKTAIIYNTLVTVSVTIAIAGSTGVISPVALSAGIFAGTVTGERFPVRHLNST